MKRALTLVRDGVQRTRDGLEPGYLLPGLHVEGLILLRQERWEEAGRVIAEGLTIAHSLPQPYMEGNFLALDGSQRLQEGEGGRGCERLREALAIFVQLGAKKDIERVEKMLAHAPLTT